MDSWVCSPGFGVLGLDSWVWNPGFGVLGFDSWFGFLRLECSSWSLGLGVLGLEPWAWILMFGYETNHAERKSETYGHRALTSGLPRSCLSSWVAS